MNSKIRTLFDILKAIDGESNKYRISRKTKLSESHTRVVLDNLKKSKMITIKIKGMSHIPSLTEKVNILKRLLYKLLEQ